MRQYRFILFKDGKPWKGLYDEVDFINEYDHTFEALVKMYDEAGYDPEIINEIAIPEFFWRFQPVRYDGALRRYVSLLRDYIIGSSPTETSVVWGIDWEKMERRERKIFEWIENRFNQILKTMTKEEIQQLPEFGVGRGSGYLNKL